MTKQFLTLVLLLISMTNTLSANAAEISIVKTDGWLESAMIEWTAVEGAVRYEVSYSGEGISGTADNPLIREYATYYRCDIPGLKAGEYQLTVKALDADEKVLATSAQMKVTVKAKVREGWAFAGSVGDARTTYAPGGYNLDGTAKSGARILYLTAKTANTITADIATDSKGTKTKATGICNILETIGKGYDSTPVIIRVVGRVAASDIKGLKDGNFLSFTGSNFTSRVFPNITIEGIGSDATLYGYGITCKRSKGVEISNLGIMLYGDDGVSMDTDNHNIWIHNCDFYYGAPGSDADQVKGDGSIDMKYNSSNITVAYNHFYDSGKVMGCGGSKETVPTFYLTVHHNWFDHTDSRCPRLHYCTAHVYNNYYDGVSVYGMGNTTETSAFMEGNYFRNCPRPMMISGQGTDKWNGANGTFSGQTGGMTKAYNNYITGAKRIVYQTEYPTDFDAWLVQSRTEAVPATATSKSGDWAYSNFDTQETMYGADVEEPANAKTTVLTYAGRQDGGDLQWTFDNATEDTNHDVITALKAAVTAYKDAIVSIQGEDKTPSGSGDTGGDTGGEGGETPSGGEGGSSVIVTQGGYVVDLMNDANSGFAIIGSTSNSKGTVNVNGTTYNICLKMGSASTITFSISEPMNMTLYFAASADKRIEVTSLGELTIPSNNIISATLPASGEYTIKRTSGESYLYYIALSPVGSTGIDKINASSNASTVAQWYALDGRAVSQPAKGQMYIVRKSDGRYVKVVY